MSEAKRPAWWYADEESFMRHLVEPEEDRRRTRTTDFTKLITDDTEKWAKVIRAANIKPE